MNNIVKLIKEDTDDNKTILEYGDIFRLNAEYYMYSFTSSKFGYMNLVCLGDGESWNEGFDGYQYVEDFIKFIIGEADWIDMEYIGKVAMTLEALPKENI